MILGSKCCCETECKSCDPKICSNMNYDYVFLICNSNSARDDEWSLNIYNVECGNVSELGLDRCQGKFFYTDISILDYIKADVFNLESPNIKNGRYCGNVPLCCLQNTFNYTSPKQISRDAFAYCGNTGFVRMTKTKQNFNGNFGNIYIWRRSFYIDSKTKDKRYGQLCSLTNTTYAARNEPVGTSITIQLSQPVT